MQRIGSGSGGGGGGGIGIRISDSLTAPLDSYYSWRHEQRPSTSSAGSDLLPLISSTPSPSPNQIETGCQALPLPTIITSTVTPPATSPINNSSSSNSKVRRDSTTQCGRLNNRRDSKAGVSPERAPRLHRLQRQATAFEEICLPGGTVSIARRDSQTNESTEQQPRRPSRRDSLSPDSACRGGTRRDSRSLSHLSPEGGGSHERDSSPHRRQNLRRQSSSAPRNLPSPDSYSCCSSRDMSPCNRPPGLPVGEGCPRPFIRRQSTTEEILIARGFRRQSTTEEMIRCRNFRRQSSQSDDVVR